MIDKDIYNKKCIINPLNSKDNLCFLYSILIHLFYDKLNKNKGRIEPLKKFMDELNYKDLDLTNGMDLKDIPKFEKMNNLKINIFSYQYDDYFQLKKYILYLSNKKDYKDEINLLYIENDDSTKGHYCYIRNINSFLRNKEETNILNYCLNCLNGFKDYKKLEYHKKLCNNNQTCRIVMPIKDKSDILKYNNLKYQHPINFKIYLDFECYLEPINENNKSINYYQKHNIMGYMMYLVNDEDNTLNKIEKYIGENAHIEFFKSLESLKDFVYDILKKHKKEIIMNKEDIKNFNESKICYLCNKEIEDYYNLIKDNNTERFIHNKVRDHCHFSGRYRGAAHYLCNINYRKQIYLPIIIHNLKYD